MKSSTSLKIAFFGTPQWAVEVADYLHNNNFPISLVVCNPDSLQGRGMTLQSPPMKTWAGTHNIPFLQPEKIKEHFSNEIDNQAWDFFIVVAYGKIMPQWLLDNPRYGTINVHFSLLPLFRGPTPVETQVFQGADNIGISIMKLDAEIDHGPVFSQKEIPMPFPLPSSSELGALLVEESKELLIKTLSDIIAGTAQPKEQNHDEATFTRKFIKQEGEINPDDNPYDNFKKIQSFNPSPGTFILLPQQKGYVRLKIVSAHYDFDLKKLTLNRVIPEGKKEINYSEYILNKDISDKFKKLG